MLIRLYLEYWKTVSGILSLVLDPQKQDKEWQSDRPQPRTNKAGVHDIQGKVEVNDFI